LEAIIIGEIFRKSNVLKYNTIYIMGDTVNQGS